MAEESIIQIRNRVKSEIRTELYNELVDEADGRIGGAILSLFPLNSDYFLPLIEDNRVKAKHAFPSLYEVYGDTFKEEAEAKLGRKLLDTEFALPVMEGLGAIALDMSRELDLKEDGSRKVLGEVGKSGAPRELLENFDTFNTSDNVYINDRVDADQPTSVPFIEPGTLINIMKEYDRFTMASRDGKELNISKDGKFHFDGIKLLWYVQYRSYINNSVYVVPN